MSAKSESLLSRFGANIAQTVAVRPAATTPAPSAPTADRYAGAVKERTFAEMPVEAIECGEQPRTEFDPEELERLAESIRRFGQLAPIRVRHDEARGKWIVLVGERRLRACKLAGLERVRVEFVERPMSEVDVLAEQIVENVVRADLQPVEQGRAYKRLMEMNGWTAQELASTLGIEPTSVYRALALLRLPDDVAERVDAGEIKPTAAYELAKLQIADDQRAVAEKIVAGTLDHKGTVVEVRRRQASRSVRKGRARTKAKLPAEIRRRGPHGVRVTASTTGKHTLADVVADLRAVADQLEQETAAGDQAAA
ncbi:MAG TPA: ParB/RepB/Spo0J family partition protein [Isosphaeraceae bacterium]|nr:ParB/RepB/Spo0J family partition protein [Isosphaeraceae bacterium]